jgi:hypothetical protein
MKKNYYVFVSLFLMSNFATASFDVGSITVTYCERLKEPREKIEKVLTKIDEKLEECSKNNLNCSAYKWPTDIKDESGEQLISNFLTVNLWNLHNTYIKALDCDFCKMEHPNEICGVTEFSN